MKLFSTICCGLCSKFYIAIKKQKVSPISHGSERGSDCAVGLFDIGQAAPFRAQKFLSFIVEFSGGIQTGERLHPLDGQTHFRVSE